MIKNRISNRDWESLSAYLDGQLSPRERIHLEARLQTSDELRTALEQLHRTRAMLRSLPRVRAPRNYTLTPEMVGMRRAPTRTYPALRFASAMATILLALVLIGDFFASRQPAAVPMLGAQPEAAPAVTMEVAVEAATESPYGVNETIAPEVGADQIQEKSLELSSPVTSTVEAYPPPAAMAAPIEATATSEATEEEEEAMAMEEPEPTPPQVTTRSLATSTPELTAEKQVFPTPTPEPTAKPVSIPTVPPKLNPLRALEVVLGLIALVTGLAALFLRQGASGS